jgi:hypothetical protein
VVMLMTKSNIWSDPLSSLMCVILESCYFSSVLPFRVFYLQKKGVTHKKADIEFIITDRVNRLFKQAIQRFKDDVKLWISYIKFCKQMVSGR